MANSRFITEINDFNKLTEKWELTLENEPSFESNYVITDHQKSNNVLERIQKSNNCPVWRGLVKNKETLVLKNLILQIK